MQDAADQHAMGKNKREQVDTANEPVEFDEDELLDTGILHEKDEEEANG